jgi:hypothetical protein
MHRNISLDYLKLILAFMVVGIHTGFFSETNIMIAYLTKNGLFRIAVPTFLLINGFYFYFYFVQNKSYEWIKRIFYLYITWTVIYSYLWFKISQISLIYILKIIIIGYFHLWYLPGMIGAAFLLIFIERFNNKSLLFSLIIFTFLSGIIIQYSGNYHLFNNINVDKVLNVSWISRSFLFFSFPFFSIGFLINKYEIYKNISLRYIVFILLIGIVLLVFESNFNYSHLNMIGFNNLVSLIIICPVVLILFLKVGVSGRNKNITLYSSGVYFVHIVFFTFFHDLTLLRGTSLTAVTLVSSLLASTILIKINKKYKYIL